MRRANLDGDHREYGTVAAPSPNERSTADALVAEGRSFDAEGANLCRERDARPGLCQRRALGPPPVPAGGVTTPRFWTVSVRISRQSANSCSSGVEFGDGPERP